jgi:hypothetical protein
VWVVVVVVAAGVVVREEHVADCEGLAQHLLDDHLGLNTCLAAREGGQ